MEEIKKHQNSPNDAVFFDYRIKYKEAIQSNTTNERELLKIQQELITIHTSLQSAEITAIKDYITLLRQRSTRFFSFNKNPKADQIEKALFETPLEMRGSVLSRDEDNPVKKDLATHVGIGVKGVVYYTNDHKINFDRAGKGYQSLITRFSNPEISSANNYNVS
ncbi:MAG: hypothetical protein ACRCXC_01325 [Legionella sp.]